jgi:glucokinase
MNTSINKKYFLAGDIGGTKTDIGIFSAFHGRVVKYAIGRYSSKKEAGLEQIIKHFLNKHPVTIKGACFGVAGPVIKGRCRTTNLPWDVSEKKLMKRFKWENVKVLNDLEAMASGVLLLKKGDVSPLNSKRVRKNENFGLIAPGTGLGIVLSIWKDEDYTVVPSEGGHADFSPGSSEEFMLWKYLKRRYGHVSLERVISGPGIRNIYSWLRDSGRYHEPKWIRTRMRKADPAKVITRAAMENNTPICVKTLNVFVSALGSAAGNLALTGMTLGGIYLGGGIPNKILPLLKTGRFMKSFLNKGRFAEVLNGIAVRVLTKERVSLEGAACIAFEHFK